MNRLTLAADLGGTNLRIAVVDDTGQIICRQRIDTPGDSDLPCFFDKIADLATSCTRDLSAGQLVDGFALAVPAILDIENGKIIEAPNLPFLNGLNITEELRRRTQLTVLLENDATAAAIGENWLGSSRGSASSVCITLGTGVGGGIILNGKPLRGVDGTAGEVGHICVEPDGFECGCGSWGCLEQYASATGLAKVLSQMSHDFPDSSIPENIRVSPKELFEYAKLGDRLALAVFERMGFALGLAIAGLVNVLNPEVVVIGGGLAASWDLFIERLRRTLYERAFRRPAERVKIVRAELGDDAGVIGAASLIFSAEIKAGRATNKDS